MPKIVDREARKKEILNAAMKVLAEKGAEVMKISDVAVAANIGKGTVYEYFDSKDDIINAIFMHWAEENEAAIGRKLLRIHDPREKLIVFMRSNIDILEKSGDMVAIIFDFWSRGIRDQAVHQKNWLKEMYHDYVLAMAGIIEEGMRQGVFRQVDAVPLAAAILGSLDGLAIQYVIKPDDVTLARKIDALVDGVLNGLAA